MSELMGGLRCSVPENEATRKELLMTVVEPDYKQSFELACLVVTGLRKQRDELVAALTAQQIEKVCECKNCMNAHEALAKVKK